MSDEILAHHEAGHAVAALDRQIPFIDVSLSKVRVSPLTFDLSNPHDIDRDAIFTLAGECAEAMVHEDVGHTSECDRKHFADLCVYRYPDDPERRAKWKLQTEREVELLIQRHWPSIQKLAARLLKGHVLSRAQVIDELKWPTSHNKQSIIWDGDF